MPRGYRYIILAAFGLLIAAGQTDKQDAAKGKKPATEQAQEQSLPPALPPIVRTISADKPDVGCEREQEDRHSDLCAQWKAADAAYDAARWGWWQMLLGGVGLLVGGGTLIAAIMAAKYANDAAKAAKDAAKTAIDMLEHEVSVSGLQLNAVLHVESVDVVDPLRFRSTKVVVKIENVGNLSAKELIVMGAWGFRGDFDSDPLTLRLCNAPKGLSQGKEIHVTLPPSDLTKPSGSTTLICQFVITYKSGASAIRKIAEVHQFDGRDFFLLRD